jgi:hypothetical protein
MGQKFKRKSTMADSEEYDEDAHEMQDDEDDEEYDDDAHEMQDDEEYEEDAHEMQDDEEYEEPSETVNVGGEEIFLRPSRSALKYKCVGQFGMVDRQKNFQPMQRTDLRARTHFIWNKRIVPIAKLKDVYVVFARRRRRPVLCTVNADQGSHRKNLVCTAVTCRCVCVAPVELYPLIMRTGSIPTRFLVEANSSSLELAY